MPRIVEVTKEDIEAATVKYQFRDVVYIAEEALELALRRESDHLRVGVSKTIRQKEYIFGLHFEFGFYKYPVETVTLDICGRQPQPFRFKLYGFPGRIRVYAKNS